MNAERTSPPLVLASASPRRRQLLAQAGLKFEVLASDVNESALAALSIRELTTWNAARKATAVARMRRSAVVLGADTLIALDGQVIGKPADLREAAKILERLSGREHQVCTAVSIRAIQRRQLASFCVISHVRFRALSGKQIAAYLKKIDPLDKAGAYAAQDEGAEVISRVRGSFTNVVGLPMDETMRALKSFGVG